MRIPEMTDVPQFDRWFHSFPLHSAIDQVTFTQQSGRTSHRPVYRHQPARLSYDRHGYESIESEGDPVLQVRFTPDEPGEVTWQALAGKQVVQSGSFTCTSSSHPGYVRVSERDSRYFAFSQGGSYCPIGVNLCWPVYYPVAKGGEFETGEQRATLGVGDYERWFQSMAAAGGNYTRLWLSSPALKTETDHAGVLDLASFARLDAIVELARYYGIKLKLCLEHFRFLETGSPYHSSRISHPAFCNRLLDPDDNTCPENIDEWFSEARWRQLWLRKVDAYIARYGDDPVVMAWELWNEINACKTSDWSIQREWTRAMLPEIKRRSPCNLVVNSLGSFDNENKVNKYREFHMDEMDFQQVHRYLDQGANLEICRTDPVALSVDAVNRTRRHDRPVILTETGGVNDNHTGRFRFYRHDHRGTLLHDVTYPAFFAGAAGSGHSWFWEHYVDPKNLWHHLHPLATLLKDVNLERENFRAVDLSTETAWVLSLAGDEHVLLWFRNKADRWDHIYRDGKQIQPVPAMPLNVADTGVTSGKATLITAWPDEDFDGTTLAVSDGTIEIPGFRYGFLAKIPTS